MLTLALIPSVALGKEGWRHDPDHSNPYLQSTIYNHLHIQHTIHSTTPIEGINSLVINWKPTIHRNELKF